LERRAARIVLRDPVDRPEPIGGERPERPEQRPVETPNEAARADGGRMTTRAESACCRVDCFDRHQSDGCGAVVEVVWKNCWKPLGAAGAAASPPWPPFSITAHTTIVGLLYGP